MARRRRYKRRNEPWWREIDWGVRPETIKETFALILGVLGIILVLSIFSAAGKVGLFLVRVLDNLFGYVGYFLPFILLVVSAVSLFPKRFYLKAISYLGMILFLIFVPALVDPYGGLVGEGVRDIFNNSIGAIAAFVLVLGLSVIALLLTFNTSLTNIRARFFPSPEEKAGVKIHGTREPATKVSVFTTVKDKIGFNKPGLQPTAPLANKVVFDLPKNGDWEFPPLDLLETSSAKATSGNIAKNVETIQKTLADFNIDVAMGDVNIGPTVTQYTLKPKEGIKLNQITARSNDLSLALAAHPIRIEAPIPGKAAVGLEVPNKIAALVTLREILESEEFKNKKSPLSFALGRDVAGTPVVVDLKKMPHLLIAGATGSGKSICLNGIITSLLYQNSPLDLRLVLIDPKRVEFTRYNGVPHLLSPVIIEVDKTVNALRWTVAEMDRRFRLFSESGRRDIDSYNSNPPQGQKLPYIVVIIDELADLMAQSAREVEAVIVRLAQMARATGIHLIVATQRPSVDVITGLIKANIISRIAFAVASQIDSRTILDMSGAEKLLGNGDMLYISSELGKPKRVQGVFISEKEVKAVTDFLKSHSAPQYDESIMDYYPSRSGLGGVGGEIDDDLFADAREVVTQAGKASASLLQRRLRVGYARAARLLDLLEAEGIIGPAEGAKPRDVLLSPSQLALQQQFQPERQQKPIASAPYTRPENSPFPQDPQSTTQGEEAPEELTEVDLRK